MSNRKFMVAGVVIAVAAVAGIGGAVTLTTVIKSRVAGVVEQQAAEALNADVKLGSVEISLVSTLPYVGVQLNDLSVIGTGDFEGVPLADIQSMYLSVAPLSALSGPIEIDRIAVKHAAIHGIVDEEGRANWDIVKDTGEASDSSYHLRLSQLTVDDFDLSYTDRVGGMSMQVDDLQFNANGDITQDVASLQTHTEAPTVTLVYGGITMLDAVKLGADAQVSYNFSSGAMAVADGGQFSLNELGIGLQAKVEPNGPDYSIDAAWQAASTDVKALWSILPSAYTADYAALETTGNFALRGSANGRYAGEEDHVPKLEMIVSVPEATVKYPDLPVPIEGITADVLVSHPGGAMDLAVVDVKALGMNIEGNPISVTARLSNPMTDPVVAVTARGVVDLASMARAYPLEDAKATGRATFDVALAGKASDFEAQNAAAVTATGKASLAGVKYTSSAMPDTVEVDKASIAFSPQAATIDRFEVRAGQSDVQGSGKLDNLLSYWLGRDVLKGRFAVGGSYADLDPYAGDDDVAATEEDEGLIVAVPVDVDLAIDLDFKRGRANGIEVKDISGTMRVVDGAARMEGVQFSVAGGTVVLDGTYTAKTADFADLDFEIAAVQLDVRQTFSTFPTLGKILPAAIGATGAFDSGFSLAGRLDSNGSPNLSLLQSKGEIETDGVEMVPSALAKVATQLADPQLGKMKLDATSLFYEMFDGKMALKDTDVLLGAIPGRLAGGAGVLDQTMDLTLNLKLPTKGLAGAPFLAGSAVPVGDTTDVAVTLIGPWADPAVKANLGALTKDAVKDAVTTKVTEAVGDDVASMIAAANAQGDALIAEAEKQAAAARSAANTGAKRIRKEGKASGAALVNEAKGNPLAVAAAKKAAEKLESQANRKADKLETEADGKATALVDAAKAKKAQLVSAATP